MASELNERQVELVLTGIVNASARADNDAVTAYLQATATKLANSHEHWRTRAEYAEKALAKRQGRGCVPCGKCGELIHKTSVRCGLLGCAEVRDGE